VNGRKRPAIAVCSNVLSSEAATQNVVKGTVLVAVGESVGIVDVKFVMHSRHSRFTTGFRRALGGLLQGVPPSLGPTDQGADE